MSDLIKQQTDNIGGYFGLEIIDVDNIYVFPNHSNFIISSNIQLLVEWFKVAATHESIEPSDGDNNTDKGRLRNHSISFFHPIDNATSLAWLNLWETKKIVAKLKTTNGPIKIYGTPTQPLRLSYKLSTKRNFDGRPGYDVTLSGLNKEPSLFFTGSTTIYEPLPES